MYGIHKTAKRRVGLKLHTIINVDETIPKMLWFSCTAIHNHILLNKLKYQTLSMNLIKSITTIKPSWSLCKQKQDLLPELRIILHMRQS